MYHSQLIQPPMHLDFGTMSRLLLSTQHYLEMQKVRRGLYEKKELPSCHVPSWYHIFFETCKTVISCHFCHVCILFLFNIQKGIHEAHHKLNIYYLPLTIFFFFLPHTIFFVFNSLPIDQLLQWEIMYLLLLVLH